MLYNTSLCNHIIFSTVLKIATFLQVLQSPRESPNPRVNVDLKQLIVSVHFVGLAWLPVDILCA